MKKTKGPSLTKKRSSPKRSRHNIESHKEEVIGIKKSQPKSYAKRTKETRRANDSISSKKKVLQSTLSRSSNNIIKRKANGKTLSLSTITSQLKKVSKRANQSKGKLASRYPAPYSNQSKGIEFRHNLTKSIGDVPLSISSVTKPPASKRKIHISRNKSKPVSNTMRTNGSDCNSKLGSIPSEGLSGVIPDCETDEREGGAREFWFPKLITKLNKGRSRCDGEESPDFERATRAETKSSGKTKPSETKHK